MNGKGRSNFWQITTRRRLAALPTVCRLVGVGVWISRSAPIAVGDASKARSGVFGVEGLVVCSINQHAPATRIVAGAYPSARHRSAWRHRSIAAARIHDGGVTQPIIDIAPIETANTMSVLYTIPRRRRAPRFAFAKVGKQRSIEALVLQAYLKLVRVAWNEAGSRSTSLAKYGQYEVRLFERMSAGDADCPHLWVELYAHDMQTSIDACGCDEIEAAAVAAEDIMCQARQLEEGERLSRPAACTTRVG